MIKNKMIKFGIILIAVVCFGFVFNSTCLANNVDKNKITNDFELIACVSSNNWGVQYGVRVNDNQELTIEAKEYNLPSNLYDYKDEIRLRITYIKENYDVLECKVINYKTGEIIKDLSEENINKLFNIEYGKNITEKKWVDIIKLSELKENEIYKYTASSTIQFPKIENDIGKNCIIYVKERDEKNYEKNINMYKEISSGTISLSYNEYNLNETFCIMYKKIEKNELLKLIKNDDIIYLSNYNDGDKLKYQFEHYIYNDTDKNIFINIGDTSFEIEKSYSTVIPKGEIYGFDWMIDSAIISYTGNNNNQNEIISEDLYNKYIEHNTIPMANQLLKNNLKGTSSSSSSGTKYPNAGLESNIFVPIIKVLIGILAISLICMIIKVKKIKKD